MIVSGDHTQVARLFARPQARRVRRSARLGMEALEARDVPAVTFTVEALANTAEGGSPANFRVTATGDPSDFTPYAVVAIYSAAGGTATFNSDFTLSPPSGAYLWFPSSGSQATVTVTPVDDNSYEGDEVVELRVQRYQMFPIGPAATGTMTIHDNDTPTVSVERLVDAAEGDTPGFFRFTRGGDTSAALTVSFEIDDQDDDFIATPGTDYQSLTSGGSAGSVTFAAGQLLKLGCNGSSRPLGIPTVRPAIKRRRNSTTGYAHSPDTVTGGASSRFTTASARRWR